MSYRVEISPQVQTDIRGWGLPRDVLLAVLNRLQVDLANDPDGLLGEQVVPYRDVFTYPFSLPGDSPAAPPRAFLFFVKRDDDKKILGVVACRQVEDTELN